MTGTVEKIVSQVKRLERGELEELLNWLADYELSGLDEWDREIERDSRPGGHLTAAIDRARTDIAQGRTKPLDEVLDNS